MFDRKTICPVSYAPYESCISYQVNWLSKMTFVVIWSIIKKWPSQWHYQSCLYWVCKEFSLSDLEISLSYRSLGKLNNFIFLEGHGSYYFKGFCMFCNTNNKLWSFCKAIRQMDENMSDKYDSHKLCLP